MFVCRATKIPEELIDRFISQQCATNLGGKNLSAMLAWAKHCEIARKFGHSSSLRKKTERHKKQTNKKTFSQKVVFSNRKEVVNTRARVARWFVFKPKFQILVNFGGYCNGRCWYIFWIFGPFYGLLVYGIFCSNLAYFSRFGILYQDKSGNLDSVRLSETSFVEVVLRGCAFSRIFFAFVS
jgi:hypothetical protein